MSLLCEFMGMFCASYEANFVPEHNLFHYKDLISQSLKFQHNSWCNLLLTTEQNQHSSHRQLCSSTSSGVSDIWHIHPQLPTASWLMCVCWHVGFSLDHLEAQTLMAFLRACPLTPKSLRSLVWNSATLFNQLYFSLPTSYFSFSHRVWVPKFFVFEGFPCGILPRDNHLYKESLSTELQPLDQVWL